MPTPLDRAYHTPLFAQGSQVMQSFYERLPFGSVRSNVYSCCSTEKYPCSPQDQVQLLVRQWIEPVRFREVLENMYRDGQRLFLELNATRTLLGFAESTFRGRTDVDLFSTGSSKPEETIDSFSQAIMNLWLKGMNVDWDQWDELFAFPECLSLPQTVRPPHAISIVHELYQYSSDDYKAAWKASSVSNPDSFSSPQQNTLVENGTSDSSHAPASNVSHISQEAVFHHQQAMRRTLESLDKNTLRILNLFNRNQDSI